ncbi:hypothetical protein BDR22DRAFT_823355 [Usnea florida]
MKLLSIAALISAYAATAAAVPQITSISPSSQVPSCTYTTTSYYLFEGGAKESTIYEQPGTTTVTQSYDCQGCETVSVTSKNQLLGVGLPVRTTIFTSVNAQATATANVCSPTPN